MNTTAKVAGGLAAGVLALGGFVAADSFDATPLSATQVVTTSPELKGCNDWPIQLTTKECFAAGTIRTALQNIQPAIQFCKWKAANPGEWSRLRALALTPGGTPQIATWMGTAVMNQLQAYQAVGAPPFELQIQLPPNACGGKLISAPVIGGVTPGQTDVTVTANP